MGITSKANGWLILAITLLPVAPLANEGNNQGTYHFDEEDLGGVAFDTVVFEALDFTNTPARGHDSQIIS